MSSLARAVFRPVYVPYITALLTLLSFSPSAWPNSCIATVNRSYVEPMLNDWPVLKVMSPAIEKLLACGG